MAKPSLRPRVVTDDIRTVAADLLALKYADGFHGADRAVSEVFDFHDALPKGKVAVAGPKVGRRALFIGVGPLQEFRYAAIRNFGRRALAEAADMITENQSLALTTHGVNTGLDEREAFLSLLTGLADANSKRQGPCPKILIVEKDPRRAERLKGIIEETDLGALAEKPKSDAKRNSALQQPPHPPVAPMPRPWNTPPRQSPSPFNRQPPSPAMPASPGAHPGPFQPQRYGIAPPPTRPGMFPAPRPFRPPFAAPDQPPPTGFGADSEEKPRLFVAMPFKPEFTDELRIAFEEACHRNGFLCERLDMEHYIGDVVEEIQRRIASAAAVIALMNERNPNVFLEIGYALALNKPLILVARENETIPFDVRNMRRIEYVSIYELREALCNEIESLAQQGVIAHRHGATPFRPI